MNIKRIGKTGITLLAAIFSSITEAKYLNKIVRAFQSEVRLAHIKHGQNCFIGNGSQIIHGEYLNLGTHITIGSFARIEAVPVYSGTRFSPQIVIEDGVDIGWFLHIACAERIHIGQNTLIAGGVYITDHNHGYSAPETFGKMPKLCLLEVAPVNIGQRCWIGEHVSILPGVTIGDDCIIGAGSIVTHNIPSGTIAVGVPARPIKKRGVDGRWQPIK